MLTDKVAVVTGSSRGIGRAIAEEFARAGADVVINYHTHPDPASAAAETVRNEGRSARVVQADVSNPDEAAALVDVAIDELGGLDLLVNNAGIYPRASWDDITKDTWQRTLEINVGGVFNTTAAALPVMKTSDDGVIINMTSMWADLGGTGNVPYTASKGAIKALTYQMATELTPTGIRTVAIAPGAIATDMNADQREDPEYVATMEAMIPEGRFGEPDEVADLAVFLASPNAAYINGTVVTIDGGLLASA